MYAVATPSRASNTTVRTRIRRTVGRKVDRFAARSPRATSRDLLDDMRNSVGVFMDRASKALPILLGKDAPDTELSLTMDEELERAEESVADVQLAQAQAASLLKPDAGRDDIFHAARQGLAGVSGKIAPIGWWDSRGQEDASPELELQALNDGSRAQLVSAVMLALKETLENIEENNGSLREVIQTVAKVSANDWMGSLSLDVGSQDRCARVVQAAGDIADEKIWQNGQILEGSKAALYASVLMYLAKNSMIASEKAEIIVADEKEINVRNHDGETVLEFFNSPMASVCVTVLQDIVLNIADSVAGAYVTCAREATAKGAVNGGVVLEEETGAIVRIPPFRDALNVRLKSTRSLEKFRNETSIRSWLEKNYYDVLAMYEDWHKLWGVNENGELVTRKIHVCRQPELQEVKGLRLAVSMVIEVADVCLPIAKSALNNCSRVASWLLVTLIGRSLGLVYRGIKESMGSNNRIKFT
mmetsp:Transcript_655/g.2563  ORF Transcript_655/g.2563 Transcript_655/m.2563 type:complete len:474 (-) Transcript_655:1887-3308(-)